MAKQKKQKWQVETRNWIGVRKYGLMFRGARLNSRGNWTRKAENLPGYVQDYLLLKQGANYESYVGDRRTAAQRRSPGYTYLEGVTPKVLEREGVHIQRGSRWGSMDIKFVVEVEVPAVSSPRTAFTDYNVDLKWSCWSTSAEVWDDYAPDAYAAIKDALQGKGDPIRIYSSPKKEIRYMTVEIVPVGKSAQIYAICRDQWDEQYEIEDTLGLDEGALDESLPYTSDGDVGVEADATFKARGVTAMKKIDAVESEAINDSAQQWKWLENHLN